MTDAARKVAPELGTPRYRKGVPVPIMLSTSIDDSMYRFRLRLDLGRAMDLINSAGR